MASTDVLHSQSGTETADRFEHLPTKESPERYNFEHFGARDLVADMNRTFERTGIQPGEDAPDFDLPFASGEGILRLSDLRGRPVLLHFGSFT